MTQPVVFISYSRKDEKEKDRLLSHLGVLQAEGLISVWSDDRIRGGANWRQEIREAMAQAKVAILLISPNFLSSDFILNQELPLLLQRREREGLTVFPVIAKTCAWQKAAWLAEIEVRPKNGRPIWGPGKRPVDEDLAAIAEEVDAIVKVGASPSPPLISVGTHKTNVSIQPWRYQAGSGVAAVAISADGETVMAGTLGKTVLCLDGAGRPRWQTKVGNQAWRVELSAEGQTAVVGTGSTRPWDMSGRGLYSFAADGSLRWQIELKASVWGLALATDGQTVAVGTSGKQLLLFDGRGNPLWKENIPGLGWSGWVFGTALSSKGELVAAASGDKQVRLLDRTGHLLAAHRTGGDVYIVTVSADGQWVATGDTQGYVYWLDHQGRLLWQERLSDKIWAVVLSANGERLLVEAGDKEKHLHVYDRGGRLLWRRHVEGRINSLALSANGQHIVSGTRDGGIHIFDEAGEILYKTQADKLIREVAISATGEHVVAGSEDGFVYGFHCR